jgi:predicted amidohydrolase YtcJ
VRLASACKCYVRLVALMGAQTKLDLIVRRVTVDGQDGQRDIGIADGRITRMAPKIDGEAVCEISAAGRLASPAFVEPHIHLDKALVAHCCRRTDRARSPRRSSSCTKPSGLLRSSRWRNAQGGRFARRCWPAQRRSVRTSTSTRSGG